MESTVAATKDIERYRDLSRGTRENTYVALLGLSVFDADALLRAVAKGLPWKAFDRLVENVGLPAEQIADAIDLPKRTRARRKIEGRFRADESDRLLRVARIYGRVLDHFAGNRAAAVRWLTQPKISLGGAVPLELARTEVGGREIEATIDRIEHGVYM